MKLTRSPYFRGVSTARPCPCEHRGTWPWQHTGNLHLGKIGMKSSVEASLLCYVVFWPPGEGVTHRHCLRCLRCSIFCYDPGRLTHVSQME